MVHLEQTPHPNLPSGYTEATNVPVPLTVSPEQLPWLDKSAQLQLARCELQDGAAFYLVSAIATHDKLVKAANGMNDQQRRNADNMFYSRIPELLQSSHSAHIESLPNPATPFPISVLRNRGGQRVYLARPQIELPHGVEQLPVIMRLAACDKNRQGQALSVLSKSPARKKIN